MSQAIGEWKKGEVCNEDEEVLQFEHSGEYSCAECKQALDGEAYELNFEEGDTHYVCAACYEIHS